LVQFLAGVFRISVFTVTFRLAVGLIYCPVWWVLLVRQPECEPDHLPSSITEMKNTGFNCILLVTFMVRYFGIELSANCKELLLMLLAL
jgi:hypothetical protein